MSDWQDELREQRWLLAEIRDLLRERLPANWPEAWTPESMVDDYTERPWSDDVRAADVVNDQDAEIVRLRAEVERLTKHHREHVIPTIKRLTRERDEAVAAEIDTTKTLDLARDEVANLESALKECQETHGSSFGTDWSNWKATREHAKRVEARAEQAESREKELRATWMETVLQLANAIEDIGTILKFDPGCGDRACKDQARETLRGLPKKRELDAALARDGGGA